MMTDDRGPVVVAVKCSTKSCGKILERAFQETDCWACNAPIINLIDRREWEGVDHDRRYWRGCANSLQGIAKKNHDELTALRGKLEAVHKLCEKTILDLGVAQGNYDKLRAGVETLIGVIKEAVKNTKVDDHKTRKSIVQWMETVGSLLGDLLRDGVEKFMVPMSIKKNPDQTVCQRCGYVAGHSKGSWVCTKCNNVWPRRDGEQGGE